jgi:hypothetical protein
MLKGVSQTHSRHNACCLIQRLLLYNAGCTDKMKSAQRMQTAIEDAPPTALAAQVLSSDKARHERRLATEEAKAKQLEAAAPAPAPAVKRRRSRRRSRTASAARSDSSAAEDSNGSGECGLPHSRITKSPLVLAHVASRAAPQSLRR